MNKIAEFRILDLFCGAGGFSYGMHRNKHFKTAVALDFNEKAGFVFSHADEDGDAFYYIFGK